MSTVLLPVNLFLKALSRTLSTDIQQAALKKSNEGNKRTEVNTVSSSEAVNSHMKTKKKSKQTKGSSKKEVARNKEEQEKIKRANL